MKTAKKIFLKEVGPSISAMNATSEDSGRPPVNWTIPKDFFDRVLKTLMAKGLGGNFLI